MDLVAFNNPNWGKTKRVRAGIYLYCCDWAESAVVL